MNRKVLPRSLLTGLLLLGVFSTPQIITSLHAFVVDKKTVSSVGSKRPQKIDKTQPVVFEAEKMDYDEKQEIITATGNVFVSQGPYLLRADRVEYHQREDRIIASGSVWIKDGEGNYSFFDHSELANQMNDGFIENLKVLMIDDSRASANKSKRYHGEKVIMWQGVYSPCPLCKTNPNDKPLWQLKGNKIIHDKKSETLTYNHAWMEVLGIPVFYTPYFYHPDPSVKRKTGLLIPEYGSSKELGASLSVPFFIATGQNHDITVYPTITKEQGFIIAGEHRYRFNDGEYSLQGSYAGDTTRTEHNSHGKQVDENMHARWHVFLRSRYDINDNTLFKFDVMRASDIPYVKKYPVLVGNKFSIKDVQTPLQTTASLENYRQTSYGIVQGYLFQEEHQQHTPVILPIASYVYETMPGTVFDKNETFYGEANFLNLFREHSFPGRGARSMVRGSLGFGGQIPYVSSWGDIWQLKADMRGDFYDINHYRKNIIPVKKGKSYTKKRIYPQTSLTWRYPFMNQLSCSQWVIEPAAMIMTSSHGGNGTSIPNEDSPIVTVEQTNLFLNDRYYGIDRIDNGSRFVYGIYDKHYFSHARKFFLFFGQTIRLDHRQVLPRRSGEDKKASNFIVGTTFAPFSWFEAQSRLMFSHKNFSVEIAESSAVFKLSLVNASFTHTYYSPKVNLQDPRNKTSQASWSVTTLPIKRFSLSYTESADWGKRPRIGTTHRHRSHLLSRSIAVSHHHDCVTTTLTVVRTGFRDKDLKPDTRVLLQFNLKNIGNIAPIQILGTGGGSSYSPDKQQT